MQWSAGYLLHLLPVKLLLSYLLKDLRIRPGCPRHEQATVQVVLVATVAAAAQSGIELGIP